MFNKKTLEFHIKSDDYFGTIAAILSLLNQGVIDNKNRNQILNEKVEELVYLQKNYKIIKKDGSKSSNKEHR
ncbi:MAG: hypothetical protein WCK59_01135 [Candidatus Falkowbacteria bacterium]